MMTTEQCKWNLCMLIESPNSSLVGAPYFQVDFDLILKNVKVTVPTSSS